MQWRVGGNGLLLALYGEVVFLRIRYRQDLGATLPLPRSTVQSKHTSDSGLATSRNRRPSVRSSLSFLLSVSAAVLCQQEASAACGSSVSSCKSTSFKAAFAPPFASHSSTSTSPLSMRTPPPLCALRPPKIVHVGEMRRGSVATQRLLQAPRGAMRRWKEAVGDRSALARKVKRYTASGRGMLMVFLPDDFSGGKGKSADSDDSSGSEDSWDQRNGGIRKYSPTTGTHLEAPEELNERLRPMGLNRHRLTIAPDEAFGAIFRMEGALMDTTEIHRKAWTTVAEEMNLTKPELTDVALAMTMPAEKAIQRVMYWTQDWGDTKRIAYRRAELFYQIFRDYDHQMLQETKDWLESLYKASIPICVCSEMDHDSLQVSLRKMGVEELAENCCFVTAEDDCDTRAQMYLTSALKLNRPPQYCVVFDSDPEGISSAHDISAQCVAILGQHAAWQLKTADLTVHSLADLTTYNIRRLFANVGEGNSSPGEAGYKPEPELELELETQTQLARRKRGPWGGYSDDDDPTNPFVGVRRY